MIDLPKGNVPTLTVRDAISHLPPIDAGSSLPAVPNHTAMKLSQINQTRIALTPMDGGDSRTWPKKLKLPCHRKSSGYYDVYGRMAWDKPAPTLTTKCISYSNGRFGHPVQNRAITPREAAALQSFPDSFVFHGSLTGIAKHIGNAVPPRLAAHLGRHILKHARRTQASSLS
jgi:DNA (cytosine-5)-methyltransferase 1